MIKIALIFLALVLILSSCLPFQPSPPQQPERLAMRVLEEIDLSELNQVEDLLRKKSVYRKNLEDKVKVCQSVFEFFFIYLNVPLDEIPDWAIEEKEKAIQQALGKNRPIDYSFMNRILERLIKEEDFSYLNSPEEKFRILKNTIRGFLNAIGDPFADYADPVEVKLGITEITRGRYEGIGVQLSLEKGKFVIGAVFDGSPAKKAGLQVGDKILLIDGKDLTGATVRDIVIYIRNKKDPTIALTIERDSQRFEVVLKRSTIKQNFIASYPFVELPNDRGSTKKRLPYNFPLKDREGNLIKKVAYLKIFEFSVQAVKDLYYVLNRIDWDKYQGLIIDLRENHGGYIYTTVAALSYFLRGGETALIVQDHQGRKESIYIPHRSTTLYPEREEFRVEVHPQLVPMDLPIVILVGSKTFSGAEVFSACLRDWQRAVLIGKERTAGKGTVNRWFLLRDGKYGALYIGVNLWLTPTGEFLEPLRKEEKGGLLPDPLVEWTEKDYFLNGQDPNWDPEIFAALDWLKIYFKEESKDSSFSKGAKIFCLFRKAP